MESSQKHQMRVLVALVLVALKVSAVERFVSPGGGHVSPFTSWADAATNIQAAIEATVNGDIVTVTNGIYDNGGKVKAGDLTNRIAIDKPILVRSVNGPDFTIIQGAWDSATTNGPGAVRCAWLTNGATLSGFTLRGGATRTSGNTSSSFSTNSGGGVWSASRGSLVTNCIVTGNAAQYSGGGVFSNTVVNSIIKGNIIVVTSSAGNIAGGGTYQSVLKNCAIVENRILYDFYITYGGGAYQGALTNCTLMGNVAYSGAGVSGNSQTPVMNCILWGNTSPNSSSTSTNYSGSELIRFSCSGPLATGAGNISAEPQLIGDSIHLAPASPCRGTGSSLYSTGQDVDGQSWSNPPSMGCDEWVAAPLITSLLKILPGPQGQLQLSTSAIGQDPLFCIWIRDEAVLGGTQYGGLGTQRLLINGFGPDDVGSYSVIVSNAFGVVTSDVARIVVRCVNAAGIVSSAPFTNWSSAATTIQTAIDAAAAGEIVLVTNGVYNVGGKVKAGDLTNRIAVDKALIVMSVSGSANTTIEATPGNGGINFVGVGSPNGTNAVRAGWLADGAILSGFTIRGGGTRVGTATAGASTNSGGGLWCATANAMVSYCVISENSACFQGGGVYGGTLNNCSIQINGAGQTSAFGFQSSSYGGGVFNSVLNNCLVRGNQSGGSGGGANGGALNNCTIMNNTIWSIPGSGAGANGSVVKNCILWNNTAIGIPNNDYSGSTMTYSRSGNIVSGAGNITNNPGFRPDGLHLSSTSPCRGAGNAAYASGTDWDGQSWTNPPSMGCDEWQPEPLLLSFRMQANSWAQFDFVSSIAGIESSPGYWFKDGSPLTVSSHYPVADQTHLTVKGVSAGDSGQYQLVVSNAFGSVTSRLANVVLHFVNAGNPGATAPYITWATAAATIQDAIEAASPDAVVVVTNGIYNTGGKVFPAYSVTNRVTVDKAAAVVSVNGPLQTIVEGRWDPVGTLGSNAVRCVKLWSNSSLAGFTLRNGATGANDAAGGGVSVYWDELVSSCIISNNRADSGGGGAWGTYYNCWFVNNSATSYGGAVYSGQSLNNCTAVGNSAGNSGGGTAFSRGMTNSIVWHNSAPDVYAGVGAYNSCSPSLGTSSGNLTSNPQLVDGFHLSVTSPCIGAGTNNPLSPTDLDGDAWLSPPSIGCDEFAAAGLTGPLAVSIEASATTTMVYHPVTLIGRIAGRASALDWSYGDGPTVTNVGYFTTHSWTNPGDYTVTFRSFNSDNPDGVVTNLLIHVDAIFTPALSGYTFTGSTNFQFQFDGQSGAKYTVEYATNLVSPITWRTLKTLTSTGGVVQISDTAATNAARFYRVNAQ